MLGGALLCFFTAFIKVAGFELEIVQKFLLEVQEPLLRVTEEALSAGGQGGPQGGRGA